MSRLKSPIAASLALLALVPVFVAQAGPAGVPYPPNCDVPCCLVACPAGDIEFDVVVRDANRNEQAGHCTIVSLDRCPSVVLCPLFATDACYPGSTDPQALTDSAGAARYNLRAGGVCRGVVVSAIKVYADGVLIGSTIAGVSPDQDGDGSVGAADQSILAAKVAAGGYDSTGDLDGNGVLDAADEGIFAQHLGHVCQPPVGNARATWGGIKTICR